MLYNKACDYYNAIHFFSPSVVVNKNSKKRKLKKHTHKKKQRKVGVSDQELKTAAVHGYKTKMDSKKIHFLVRVRIAAKY